MLRTFGDIIELTLNRIDETDVDEQIDIIVKNAINESYISELSQIDKKLTTAYIPIINGVGALPDDFGVIESISPTFNNKERITGSNIISNRNITFTVLYSVIPEYLINNEDIPEISTKYLYLLSTYACFAYYSYRKKTNIAQMFMQEYETGVNKLRQAKEEGYSGENEVVNDYYAKVGDE